MNTRNRYIALTLLVAFLLLVSASCSKKTEKAPEPQATAEAPKANEATAEAPAPTINQPEAEVPADNAEKTAEQANNASPCNCPCAQDKPSEDSDKSDSEKENSEDEKDSEIEDSDKSDSEKENSEDEKDSENEDNCYVEGEPERQISDKQLKKLFKFGHRHEIQGDMSMSDAKWADLEPTLPVSMLKVSPNDNVTKQLESTLNYNCSNGAPIIAADGTSVQLIFCSKKDRPTSYKEENDVDGETVNDEKIVKASAGFYLKEKGESSSEIADFAYISLTSPKDHYSRIYQIDSDIEIGDKEGSTYDLMKLFYLTDVESRPFMDTTGIYVRIVKIKYHRTEHSGHNSHEEDETYKTWLFAGDNHRLVTSWIDSSYGYFWDYSDGEKCPTISYSESYEEKYIQYEDGKFETEDGRKHEITIHWGD